MPVVRDAADRDIDFLVGLQLEQMRREHPDENIERLRALSIEDTRTHIHNPEDGCVLSVIERDGHRIGRLRVVRTRESILLAGIQLVPAVRGQGVGTTIIGRLQDEARAGDLPLLLSVHRANADAQRLYARLGFERYSESDTEFFLSWR